MAKAENKESHNPRGKKDKRRDLVLDKVARKVVANHIVKKALVALGEYSSESGESKCPDDASMLVI